MLRHGTTLVLVGALLVLLLATPAAAQRITGGISGTVKDPNGGPLPGVTVGISGENIVGEQYAITNHDGFYRVIGLPPGAYDVNFELSGFRTETRTGLRVGVGSTTVQNITLAIGEVSEQITVISEAPVVDSTSNEVGTNFDRDWVENAPMQRLSFNDLVADAPGSIRGGVDSRRTMVYGSSYDENSFQLDGADVNDNFFNEQLAQPNIDAIEEIEVLSLGAPAEYGNLTGAVYNIVTRQGTNQFHGDVNYFTQNDGLTSSNTNADEDGGFPYRRDEYNDYTGQVGGPLSRDKLWFFLSYQRQEDGYSKAGVDPDLGTVNIETDRYFGKLNFQINPSHKLVATFHQDEQIEPYELGPNESPTTRVTRDGKTPTPGLGYSGVLNNKTTIDVRFTGFYGDVFLGPSDPSLPRDQPRIYDVETSFISGGHYYWYDLEPTRTTINAKVTYLADDFLGGSHDFRFGVQYNESEAGGIYGYNDLIFLYPSYGYGYGYTRVPFSYSGNTEAIGLFADDTWRVNDRLSVNIGVRYDSNDAFSKEQPELDATGNPTGVVFPRADYYTWEYWSPRLGFNYQLTSDGRTVLKGHIGRYHRAIATGEFANVIGPSIKPIFGGFWDPETQDFFEIFQITDNSNLNVDPNYKSPQTDQYILSLERQIGRDMGLYLNLVRKEGSDFAAWEDIGGIYEETTYIDSEGTDATGLPITVYALVGGERDFIITNRPEMDTEISAASLNFVKRMSNRWSLNASATYLKSEGRTPDSGGPTGIQQRGGLQFRNFGRNPNDFVNSGGRLRGDIPLTFKTQFVYQLPLDFMVALNMTHRDGANRVRRVRVPDLGQSTRILAQERGTSGRLPNQTLVDVRVQKDFKLWEGGQLGIMVDIFNILNDDAYEEVVSSDGTSSNFNVPDTFVLPRRVMLGARLRF